MMRSALVLGMGLLLTSCGLGTCTVIGCQNAVTFQLGAAGQHFGMNEPVQVRACIGTQCADETVTNTGSGSSSSTGSSIELVNSSLRFTFNTALVGTQQVTLELKKNGNIVLSDMRDVMLVSSMPNGPTCGPTCHSATVSL